MPTPKSETQAGYDAFKQTQARSNAGEFGTNTPAPQSYAPADTTSAPATTTAVPDSLASRLQHIMDILGGTGTTAQGDTWADQTAPATTATASSTPTADLGVGANVSGPMDANSIYQAAVSAGFSHDQAVTMTAIALAESSGNPNAHNPNRATGDNSYGLWQINMIDSMGPQRLKEFGLTSNDQLFDPNINARAAFAVSGGGANFGPWTTFTSGKYKTHLAQAQAAAQGA